MWTTSYSFYLVWCRSGYGRWFFFWRLGLVEWERGCQSGLFLQPRPGSVNLRAASNSTQGPAAQKVTEAYLNEIECTSPIFWNSSTSERPNWAGHELWTLWTGQKSGSAHPDFWLEPMSRTLWYLSFKKHVPPASMCMQSIFHLMFVALSRFFCKSKKLSWIKVNPFLKHVCGFWKLSKVP